MIAFNLDCNFYSTIYVGSPLIEKNYKNSLTVRYLGAVDLILAKTSSNVSIGILADLGSFPLPLTKVYFSISYSLLAMIYPTTSIVLKYYYPLSSFFIVWQII